MAMFLLLVVIMGVIIFGGAWVIYEACDGFDLNKSINRGIATGISEGLSKASAPGGAIDRAVISAIAESMEKRARENLSLGNQPLTATGFTWEIAFEFIRIGEMKWEAAFQLAKDTLTEFLRDEGIHYGHGDYAWTQSGAQDIAREMEIDHWEAR